MRSPSAWRGLPRFLVPAFRFQDGGAHLERVDIAWVQLAGTQQRRERIVVTIQPVQRNTEQLPAHCVLRELFYEDARARFCFAEAPAVEQRHHRVDLLTGRLRDGAVALVTGVRVLCRCG
jgi:hypothetical protein